MPSHLRRHWTSNVKRTLNAIGEMNARPSAFCLWATFLLNRIAISCNGRCLIENILQGNPREIVLDQLVETLPNPNLDANMRLRAVEIIFAGEAGDGRERSLGNGEHIKNGDIACRTRQTISASGTTHRLHQLRGHQVRNDLLEILLRYGFGLGHFFQGNELISPVLSEIQHKTHRIQALRGDFHCTSPPSSDD